MTRAPGARERRGQDAGSGADVEHELAGADPRVGDDRVGPGFSESVPAPPDPRWTRARRRTVIVIATATNLSSQRCAPR